MICLFVHSENIVVYDDLASEDKYINLDQLGAVLRRLSEELPGALH